MATDKILAGYEQSIGGKLLSVVDHYGPASYNQATGDVYPASNLGRGGFDAVEGGRSFSGNYTVAVQYPSGYQGEGVPQVALIWLYAGVSSGVTGATVTLGSGPTDGTYTITATAGAGQIQVVVSSGAVASVTVLNPGSYASAPTFTPPAGLGSGASITATVGAVSGGPVAASTDLSAEAVRLVCLLY